MLSLLSVVMFGFFLGMRHATDPDHVIAVTTIVSRHRTMKGAGLIGAAWGLGHTITIIAVGGAIILLGWAVPPRVELSMEFAVGLMLVGLGAWNLRGLRQWREAARAAGSAAEVQAHTHRHGDYVHTHPHAPGPQGHPHAPDATPLARLDRRFGSLSVYQLARPLVIGVVHGLAGSAAATLLVLAIINDPMWAMAYLAVFGVGTIAGMMLITAALAAPFAWAGGREGWLHGALRTGAGALSIAFGLFLAYETGIVEGLFRS
jgi:high-affinity nickel-transport protein